MPNYVTMTQIGFADTLPLMSFCGIFLRSEGSELVYRQAADESPYFAMRACVGAPEPDYPHNGSSTRRSGFFPEFFRFAELEPESVSVDERDEYDSLRDYSTLKFRNQRRGSISNVPSEITLKIAMETGAEILVEESLLKTNIEPNLKFYDLSSRKSMPTKPNSQIYPRLFDRARLTGLGEMRRVKTNANETVSISGEEDFRVAYYDHGDKRYALQLPNSNRVGTERQRRLMRDPEIRKSRIIISPLDLLDLIMFSRDIVVESVGIIGDASQIGGQYAVNTIYDMQSAGLKKEGVALLEEKAQCDRTDVRFVDGKRARVVLSRPKTGSKVALDAGPVFATGLAFINTDEILLSLGNGRIDPEVVGSTT